MVLDDIHNILRSVYEWINKFEFEKESKMIEMLRMIKLTFMYLLANFVFPLSVFHFVNKHLSMLHMGLQYAKYLMTSVCNVPFGDLLSK